MNRLEWLTEDQTPTYRVQWKINRVLHEEQTAFQHLQVVEMDDFGRALVLDGAMQTTVGDEHIYHEMIAHVPLATHPKPERVLVIGGGDGGTIREVLRHRKVKSVEMVEIDGRVIELSQQYLPEIAAELNNPRLKLRVGDGIEHLRKVADHSYDVILIDSCDPVGPAEGLFNRAFYENVRRALKPDGLVVCQTASPFFHQKMIREVHQTLADLFPITRLYLACVPTYPSGLHSFVVASKRHDPKRGPQQPVSFETRWYTDQVHRAAFVLPPMIAQVVAPEETAESEEELA